MLGINPLVSGLEHRGWREDTGRAAGRGGFAPSGAAECRCVNNWHSPAVVQDLEQPRDRWATRPLSRPDPEQPQGLCGRCHASAGSSQLLLPSLQLGFRFPGVRMGLPPGQSAVAGEVSEHRGASEGHLAVPREGPRGQGRRAACRPPVGVLVLYDLSSQRRCLCSARTTGPSGHWVLFLPYHWCPARAWHVIVVGLRWLQNEFRSPMRITGHHCLSCIYRRRLES